MLFTAALGVFLLPSTTFASPAGVARWVAETAKWGTLTASPPSRFIVAHDQNSTKHVDPNNWENISAAVVPVAASKKHGGRIFFYLMHKKTLNGAALTLSQASFETDLFAMGACGQLSSAADAQDPRCAKTTFMGDIAPCDVECEVIGKEAFFTAHPSMESWPTNHDFHVLEMRIDTVWMIANFGGGIQITSDDYTLAEPVPHKFQDGSKVDPLPPDNSIKVPNWNDTVARSRWIVHHARWTTVSTSQHSQEEGQYFGNVRAVTDGPYCESSTGRPVFQFPNVDPTAKDMVQTEYKIALTFTEASIAARLAPDTMTPCGGEDAGSPTCGQVVLYGRAVPLDSSGMKVHHALGWFKKTHPLADWLATGGSHMSGKYYTISIAKIVILDFFGGFKEVNVDDYLQFDFTEYAGKFCQAYPSSAWSSDDAPTTLRFSVAFLFFVLILILSFQLGKRHKKPQSYQVVAETTSAV